MYSSTLPSTSALDGSGWSTPRPGRFTPRKDPVPIVQEAGWAPGTVWTGAENLTPPEFDPQTVQSVASRYTDELSRPLIFQHDESIRIHFNFYCFTQNIYNSVLGCSILSFQRISMYKTQNGIWI